MEALEESMLRLDCVRIAGGDLTSAKEIYNFVSGMAELKTCASIKPPVDNCHVAPGCEQFTEEVIKANDSSARSQPKPTYWVRHPNNFFSVADPQPL